MLPSRPPAGRLDVEMRQRSEDESPIIGSRRDGRVCVAAFAPPDTAAKFGTWKDENQHRHGPPDEWQVDTGRASDGREFVLVWVLKQYAHPLN
jgi:hypothetical protein